MATLQPTIERRQSTAAPLQRISWGAIFAGAAIATAVMVLLGMLGIAVGATVIEPASGDSPSARAMGIGAGIWWVVSGILALFAGGWSAGRLACLRRQWEAPLHGLVSWAVTTAALLVLMSSAAGAIASGALHVVSTGARLADASGQSDRAGARLDSMTRSDESGPTERDTRKAADVAADAVATAAWWTTLFLLLSAAAAVAGAVTGTPSRESTRTVHPNTRSPVLPGT